MTVIKSTFLMIVFVNCSYLCMFCLAEKKNIKSANTVSFPLMSQLEACSGSSFDSLIYANVNQAINQELSRQSEFIFFLNRRI